MKDYIIEIGFGVEAENLEDAKEKAIEYLRQVDYIKNEEVKVISI